MKNRVFHKIASMALVLGLLVSCMPVWAVADSSNVNSNKVADPSTLNDYQKYFVNPEKAEGKYSEMDTSYAGLVWTDKSVFTDKTQLRNALGTLPEAQCQTAGHQHAENSFDLMDDQNFLVTLSASASNKSIAGFVERPTDTIFVLDVTGSMDSESATKDADTAYLDKIEKLVRAVNPAIDKLLANNGNNRVGVVVFSAGKGDGRTLKVFLELGRYTSSETDMNKKYIEAAEDGDHVWVSNKVKIEGANTIVNSYDDGKGNESDRSSRVHHSTYTQGGLNMALKEFKKVTTDITAEVKIKNETQTTIRRIPALVLVTDGNPTHATADYMFSGDYSGTTSGHEPVLGDGSDGTSTLGMAFLCQLTAIWVKEEMGDHYNEIGTYQSLENVPDPIQPLFYTMGIGIQNRPPASAVLNPAGNDSYQMTEKDEEDNVVVTERLSDYWNMYLGNGTISEIPCSGTTNASITRSNVITANRYSPNQVYANRFFEVVRGTTDEYKNIMDQIIQDIMLQSGYTPTMLQTGDGFNDGYVTFVDDIGEHMEIKDVKGIAVGDKLFTSEHLARMMNESTLGSLNDPDKGSAAGHQMIDAIATRLGLSTASGSAQRAQAIGLINKAYEDGLLGVLNSGGNVIFGNSFGWLAGSDGDIVGKASGSDMPSYEMPVSYWNWQTDTPSTPASSLNAAYKVRSYIFYDDMESASGTQRSTTAKMNAVYMSVQVRERLSDGKVSLIWRIPARLIPVNEYHIDLNETNTEVESIALAEKPPVRLIYEVGPKDGYKSYQIEETMQKLIDKGYQPVDAAELDEDWKHIVKDTEGYYRLYTNAVDKMPTNPNHVSQHVNTVSYFKPSNQNERYRFSAPTRIYDAMNGNTLTRREEELDPNGSYWYKQYVFAQDANGNRTIQTVWNQIEKQILQTNGEHGSHARGHTHITKKSDREWYVNVNTIEFPNNPILETKSSNPTDTLEHADRSVLEKVSISYEHDGIQANDFVISNVMGNNGMLRVKPDTGIAIRKKLVEGDASEDFFSFVVSAVDANDEKLSGEVNVVIDKPEPDTDEKKKITFRDGEASLTGLKAGWTAHLSIPAGMFVTITEVLDGATGYKLETVMVENGVSSTPNEATEIEIKPGSQAIVVFTNDVPDNDKYGLLALKKIATHNYKYGFDIPEDAEFVFQLTFEKEEKDTNIYANDVIYDTDGNAYLLDSKGMAKDVTLNPNQEIVFTGLADGSKVTVSEIIEPDEGYEVEEIVSTFPSIEVKDEQTVQVEIEGDEEHSVTVRNIYLDPSLPATGDSSSLVFWTALLALCSIAAIVRMKKYREI